MYGLFAFLAVVAGVSVVVVPLLVARVKVNEGQLACVLMMGFTWCLFGAWLMDNTAHWLAGEQFGKAGISALGGITAGIAVAYLFSWYVYQSKQQARYLLHVAVPAVTLAHAFGRIGCYFGGCCYGVPSKLGIGVTYPAGSKAAIAYGVGTKLVPTQFIESAFLVLLTVVLLCFVKRRRIVVYFYAYGVYRYIAEFWRGDNRGAFLPFMSPSQFMSICIVVAATVILILQHIRHDDGRVVVPECLGKLRRKRVLEEENN